MIHDVTGGAAQPTAGLHDPGVAKGKAPASPAAPVVPAPTAEERVRLEDAVAKVRDAFEHLESELKIEIDPDVHRVVVKVLNERTGELIRQIPAEELLEIAKRVEASQALLLTKRT
ncbi:flagellar protein FlaG [Candidatus Nitrospira bockiana]